MKELRTKYKASQANLSAALAASVGVCHGDCSVSSASCTSQLVVAKCATFSVAPATTLGAEIDFLSSLGPASALATTSGIAVDVVTTAPTSTTIALPVLGGVYNTFRYEVVFSGRTFRTLCDVCHHRHNNTACPGKFTLPESIGKKLPYRHRPLGVGRRLRHRKMIRRSGASATTAAPTITTAPPTTYTSATTTACIPPSFTPPPPTAMDVDDCNSFVATTTCNTIPAVSSAFVPPVFAAVHPVVFSAGAPLVAFHPGSFDDSSISGASSLPCGKSGGSGNRKILPARPPRPEKAASSSDKFTVYRDDEDAALAAEIKLLLSQPVDEEGRVIPPPPKENSSAGRGKENEEGKFTFKSKYCA